MDALDHKLNEQFPGKVVRKDLVHQIKKAANVPSFVLEFLLSKYCATDDPDEIEAGKKAVLNVIESNYVRPNEANRAQSIVHQKGRHKFIDKVHVKFYERERRHWAAMENFNSTHIAINEKFYAENEKLLEGGIWAEVKVAHNDVEEDDYAFYIEELKPIQLARFNEQQFLTGRSAFTRDEWIDVILRSVGLNPAIMDNPPPEIKSKFPSGLRLKLHFLARLIPLVQSNYNFLELGPRGTGKSYFYSEFSPYSTLLSGGQASTATLLYNNARKKVGAVGFWDNIGFDEVGNMKIKDSDTIQIMKDYMANGRFSRGQEVIASASFAFVGNIDHSVEQLVNSYQHDLFITLPKAFDLAVQDRFFFFLPGWEIPKTDQKFLTNQFGLITDYMAEAFHYLFKHNTEYFNIVNRVQLGPNVQGRDELAIRKTISGLLKIIHPDGKPSPVELDELVAYAIEGRRRVKEQMNKRKPDDEFALIDLSFVDSAGIEQIIYCPESRYATATQNPRRSAEQLVEEPAAIKRVLIDEPAQSVRPSTADELTNAEIDENAIIELTPPALTEKHVKIHYGDRGFSYETVFGAYLIGAVEVVVEDPFIRTSHQIGNFLRFCELLVKLGDCEKVTLVTGADSVEQQEKNKVLFAQLGDSLEEQGVFLTLRFSETLHDREVWLSNGWRVRLGRGLDYFQSPAGNYLQIGTNDYGLRPCLETNIDFFKS
ncbi:BREX system Lon protease-like protein BrxL [Dyadobacter sandarakinus]|uniref:BREX system Lon protease-like protein BrxL n=1 Tax=Dyadobacter sandarakinus TaxID=2747268 RepID=A0ABX7I0G8_9BACT|nr:BREX system Lon protease-like protein BrxL [Dyadobacter sandarakinus]QRQ99506.1 BREX system Lon protease-like protein BrxL [Dyadobacter sandarakinus]